MNEWEIYSAALEIEDRRQRDEFLENACGEDQALRERIELLLKNSHSQDSFLERPPTDLVLDRTAAIEIGEKPGDQVGPFKLLQKIGEGGMGVVFMAEQRQPVKRRVALKIIKPGMDSRQVIARFEAERQALAMMDHPNIARALDVGTTDSGRPFFVMELVKGMPITKYCDEHKLTPRQRLELFIPVCGAIQHAHQKGIIHRDIKPSNILVAEYDNKAVPKIIDFGVAKALNQTLTEKTMFTQLGQVIGTLEYMSPEQAKVNQLDVDTRSDIYSLGVLLYELLSGNTPFDRERLRSAAWDELVRIIREEEPPRMSLRLSTSETLPSIAACRQTEPGKLSTLIRGELDWIVMKALDKERNRRYETANGFAMDIQRYLDDEPVHACPPSATYRFRKFVRRNKAAMATGSLVAAALLLGLIGTTWGLLRSQQKQAEAETQRARAEAREQDAIDAVKQFGQSVAENPILKNSAELESLRETLLKQPLAFFESLREQLQEDRDTSPESLNRLASAALQLASLNTQIGSWEDALQALEEGLAIGRQVHEMAPDNQDYRAKLAEIERQYGNSLKALGKLDQAQGAYQASLDLLEPLAAEFPNEDEYSRAQAAVFINLAILNKNKSQLEQATSYYLQAIERRQALLDANPDEIDDLYNLAAAHNSLGNHLRLGGQDEQAESHYRQALSFCKRLVAQQPEDPEHQSLLAQIYSDLALLQISLNQLNNAIIAMNQARDNIQALVDEYPSTTEYRRQLGQILRQLAIALGKLGKYSESESMYHKCIEVRQFLAEKHPNVPDYQASLADAHDQLALMHLDNDRVERAEPENRKAIEICRQLATRYPEVPLFHRQLAMSYKDLGYVLRQHKPTEAEAAYQETLAILEMLSSEFKEFPLAGSDLASTYADYGAFLRLHGRLQEALSVYEKAIVEIKSHMEQQATRQPTELDILATNYRSMAFCLDELERIDEAEAAYRQAIETRSTLVKEFPDVPSYQTSLAGHYCDLGGMLRDVGRLDEAQAALEEAENILSPLVQNNDELLTARRFLRNTLHAQGLLLMKQKQPAQARLMFSRTLEIDRQMVEEYPNDPLRKQHLGITLFNRGIALKNLGHTEEARANFGEAVEFLQALVEQEPDNIEYRETLGKAQEQLAIVLRNSKNYGKSLEVYEAALGNQKKIAEAKPEQPEYQLSLAKCHGRIGDLFRDQNQLDDALGAYEQAITIVESLVANHASVEEYSDYLGVLYLFSATIQKMQANPRDAIAQFENVETIFGSLAKKHPQNHRHLSIFSYALSEKGQLLGQIKENTKAQTTFEALIELLNERLPNYDQPDQRRQAHEIRDKLYRAHFYLAVIHVDSGDTQKARTAYRQADQSLDVLIKEVPSNPDYHQSKAAVLRNLGRLHVGNREFKVARAILEKAFDEVDWFAESNPDNPAIHTLHRDCWLLMTQIGAVLGDRELVLQSRRELQAMTEHFPNLVAQDQRAEEILSKAATAEPLELHQLALRAYNIGLFSKAIRLLEIAMEQDPDFAGNRTYQPSYNVACFAALTADGQAIGEPLPEENEKLELRKRALKSLEFELEQWNGVLESDSEEEIKTAVEQLSHWLSDYDLTSVRDPGRLAKLDATEREAWEVLWERVRKLLAKAESTTDSESSETAAGPAARQSSARRPATNLQAA
jgi:serine/threonine protein kinase